MRKLKFAFLDRDGVVLQNRKPFEPSSSRSVTSIQFCEGAVEAIGELKKYFDFVVVLSNQPDVARGLLSETVVIQQNNFILDKTLVDMILTCMHDDKDQCRCRKPKTGLFEAAIHGKELNLDESIMVGDRWRDVEAGNRFGLTCFFIDYSYNEKRPTAPYFKVKSLKEVVDLVRCRYERKVQN